MTPKRAITAMVIGVSGQIHVTSKDMMPIVSAALEHLPRLGRSVAG